MYNIYDLHVWCKSLPQKMNSITSSGNWDRQGDRYGMVIAGQTKPVHIYIYMYTWNEMYSRISSHTQKHSGSYARICCTGMVEALGTWFTFVQKLCWLIGLVTTRFSLIAVYHWCYCHHFSGVESFVCSVVLSYFIPMCAYYCPVSVNLFQFQLVLPLLASIIHIHEYCNS